MYRSTILKLYPDQKQQDKLKQHLGACRYAYNYFLRMRIRHYRIYGKKEGFKGMTGYDCCNRVKELRNRKSFLKDAPSFAIRTKLLDLDKAYKAFFRRKFGFPSFKKRGQTDTMRFDRSHISFKGSNRIWIPKIGWVKFRGRVLGGKLRNVTIKKFGFGRYEVAAMYEVPEVERDVIEAVGIDLNCHELVLSDKTKYIEPKYLFQDKIKRWGRILSRRDKGSHRREKARRMLAKWHYKAARKRNYFLQKLTSEIAYRSENQARFVVLEDLRVDNLTRKGKGKRKRGLNRSMRDSCMGYIKQMLSYKTATIKAPTFYASSKLCSKCGHKYKELSLSERTWRCCQCHTEHDRDINAATNLIKWASDTLRGDEGRPAGMNIPEGIHLRNENLLSFLEHAASQKHRRPQASMLSR